MRLSTHTAPRALTLAILALEVFHLTAAAIRTDLPFNEVAPIINALPAALPSELRERSTEGQRAIWPNWLAQHDSQIRARIIRGDEDSLVNFLLFGTTFTSRIRATERELAKLGGQEKANELVQGRIEDLIAAITGPGTDERLAFAREVIRRKGIRPASLAGKEQLRRYLNETGKRMAAESVAYQRSLEAASTLGDGSPGTTRLSTLYEERGLSSDTKLLPDFAIHRALEAMVAQHALRGPIRRIAIVGPGLDFTDKADGYDFYPVQSVQPFAIIDSVVRLGLGRLDDLTIQTLDLSPRVNRHLADARTRARRGDRYFLALPLNRDENWDPALLSYWNEFGSGLGAQGRQLAAPPNAGNVMVRALEVPPRVVLQSIFTEDLNIVTQRLIARAPDERFDLVVATNILSYYGEFDQAMALANIGSMLRPGGFLVSNSAVTPITIFAPTSGTETVRFSDRQYDRVFWYQRR